MRGLRPLSRVPPADPSHPPFRAPPAALVLPALRVLRAPASRACSAALRSEADAPPGLTPLSFQPDPKSTRPNPSHR